MLRRREVSEIIFDMISAITESGTFCSDPFDEKRRNNSSDASIVGDEFDVVDVSLSVVSICSVCCIGVEFVR